MSSFSYDRADKLLNGTYRSATYTKPSAVYVALLTGAGDKSLGADAQPEYPATQGYTRVALTQADGTWTAPANGTNSGRVITNVAQVDFPTPTGDYTTQITHAMLCDSGPASGTAGNVLELFALTTPRDPVSGGDLNFPVGELKIEYT